MRVFGLALLSATALFAIDQPQLSQQQVDEIVQKFAAKETAFAQARENYTYKQSAKIQTLDESGNPTGKWEQVSDIIFSSEGKAHRARNLRAGEYTKGHPADAGRHAGFDQRAAFRADHR